MKALTIRLTDDLYDALVNAANNYDEASTERDRAEMEISDHHFPAWFSVDRNDRNLDRSAHTIAGIIADNVAGMGK